MGVLEYMLIGVCFGFLMEYFGKHIDVSFGFRERLAIWSLWPIIMLVVIYHFFKELFNRE